MKENKLRNNRNKAAVFRTHSASLFIGFSMLILLSSCIFAPSTPTPKPELAPIVIHYVDGNLGSDINPGSQAQPWKTIQKAADTAGRGDIVKVIHGSYSERVKIAQPKITFEAMGFVSLQGFTINANDTTVNGFYITDTPNSDEDGSGFLIAANNCMIENNHVYFTTRGGIYLSDTSSNCVVRNNKLERNSQLGIEVHGVNHLLEGNEIWGSIQYHPQWINPPSWVDADGIRFFGFGHVFRGNYIHDIHFGIPENINPHIDCFQTWTNSGHETATNILFEKNICINPETQAAHERGQGFMIQDGANNLTIRNNIIRAFIGINLVKAINVTIVNNDFIGNTITSSEGTHSLAFYSEDSKDVIYQNNIIYDYYSNIAVTGRSITGGNNLAYRTDDAIPANDSAYDNSKDLWGINPLFIDPSTNDFHLQRTSPAIDAGYNIGELVSDDIDSILRPQGEKYDIGAYEYPK